jgi:glycosyltransferase involved in cell wall biosynthesis
MNTKISVITIARNEEKLIQETLQSICEQETANFECVIIDGNSTDQTAVIAQTFCQKNKNFKFFTQKSHGISNAFNEGILQSQGDFLLFVNASDTLKNPHALKAITQEIEKHPQEKLFCFQTEYMEENGTLTGKIFPHQNNIAPSLQWGCLIAHQSTLISRDLFISLGFYNPSFQIAMDYEFWLRCLKYNVSFHVCPYPIANHRLGGVSTSQLTRSRLEVVVARWLHLSFFRKSLFNDFIQLFFALQGKLFKK